MGSISTSNHQTYKVVSQGGSIATLTESQHLGVDASDGLSGAKCDQRHDEECAAHLPSHRYRLRKVACFATLNLIDDEALLDMYRRACRVGDSPGADDGGLVTVKLVKFLTWAVIGILIVHPLARWMGWEIDENYTLRDFIQYDFHVVLLDLLFFFVVGRLYNTSCRGVDSLFPWGVFVTLGAVFPSIANNFEFLRHSVSLYDIHCSWPAMLFIYAFFLLVMSITFIVALIRSHHRRVVLRSRMVEAMTLLCLFILPYAALASDSFHLHHWFIMWWLGMQSNAPEWWSRSFQAFALGSYINGIAVYGRDPVLECKHAFYVSTNQQCAFMQCYEGENETEYKEFIGADWKLCNAESLRNNETFVQ